jgi:hypothetical protein
MSIVNLVKCLGLTHPPSPLTPYASLLMPVSTGNDMIEGARKMYTWFSGHVQEVTKEGYVSILNYSSFAPLNKT